MANLFLNLPAPAANAAGAAVDVTAMGATKTIVVQGNGTTIFEPFVVIEISCDAAAPTVWTPLTTFTKAGEKTFNVACNFMRARTTNYTQGGAPTVDVGSIDVGTQTAALVAPAGNGNGAGVDISALGDYTTVQVSGTYKGSLNIEVSNDGGTSWGPANMTFVQGAAPKTSSTVIVADFMRVSRSGIQSLEPNPGLPVINVCGSELTGGSEVITVITDMVLEPAISPPALAAGTTNDYAPTGIADHTMVRQATDAAGSALSSLAAQEDGAVRVLENLGPGILTIINDSGGTAANRFINPGAVNAELAVGGAVAYRYSTTTSRWEALWWNNNRFTSMSLAVATPPTPAAGLGTNMSTVDIAGRSMPSYVGPDGFASTLQPFTGRRNVGTWRPLQGASNPVNVNMANITVNGTATARTPASTNLLTSLRRIGVVSGAGAGNQAFLSPTATLLQFWRGNAAGLGGFHAIFRFAITDAVLVATANMFVGLRASLPGDVAPSTLVNQLGIGVDNGDTNLQLYAAGAVAQARVDLGANFPADSANGNVYELALFAPPNAAFVNYQVTRLNVPAQAPAIGQITAAANLPASTQFLAPYLIRGNGGTAAAVAFDLVGVYIETNT